MNGNKTQYDPSEMFREWIQKSGKAQAEFMRNFGAMMGQPTQSFDPLQTLKEIADKTSEAQTNQMMPNFLQWGAYKTSVGTNGRISIPEAERDALGLKEGDLVQVIVLPLEKKSKRR